MLSGVIVAAALAAVIERNVLGEHPVFSLPPKSVHPDHDLSTALDVMVSSGARQVPVTNDSGCFIGFVEEPAIAQAYLRAQRDGARGATSDFPPPAHAGREACVSRRTA